VRITDPQNASGIAPEANRVPQGKNPVAATSFREALAAMHNIRTWHGLG
jgi:hypothetical protein